MKKITAFIFFILLLFTSLAIAFNDDIFSYSGQPESIEGLSSEIESSYPHIARDDALELAESIYLIRKLEKELSIANQLLGISMEDVEEKQPIVLAKHTSEGAETNIPREEESLITELEKEEQASVPEPAGILPSASLPKIDLYTKKELERNKSRINIEKGQLIIITAVGLKRFMVTEPRVAKAVREGTDKINVTGTSLGSTFIHVWESEGRRTVKITVVQKGYKKFVEARKKAREITKMESFKVKYSFDRYRLNSKSVNPARSFHFTEWFHRLGITGETPWGRVNSRFQYEGNEFGGGTKLLRDLTAWDFNLRGDDVEISLGDTWAKFSDITLPSTSYQGIRFKNPDDKNVNYDLVWGARGNRMWGYRVEGFDNANYFWGARAQVEPADFIHFNVTALRSQEDGEEHGEYIYAAGTGLYLLDGAIEVEAEAARNKSEESDQHNHAYKVDSTLRLSNLNLLLKGTYRDIEPDFLLVTGTTPANIGEMGYYFDVTYNPLKYFRLTGQYNRFRNRYNFNARETQRFNTDWLGSFIFNLPDNSMFRYSIWKRLREGENTPARGGGQTYQISHRLELPGLLRPVRLYARYEPSQYKNLNDPSPNYIERKTSAGMSIILLDGLSCDLSHIWQYRKMFATGESGAVKTMDTGLRYSRQILNTPFYGSMSLRYRKEYDVMENLPLTSGESVVTGEGEIKYRPLSGGFETYLRVNRQHIRGVLDASQDRQETRIYGGGSYLFDTTLRWGTGGSLAGYVFKDLNGNGERELDEEGLAGIDVYAGNRSIATDSNGRFEFRKIKGTDIQVLVDTKMLPKGYKPTTPSSQTVVLERGYISEANFGVTAISEIYGKVFNDVNMNSVPDEGDVGVKGILLVLDDGSMAQTMGRGDYRIEDVRQGKKTLTLDNMTLPPYLIPLEKPKREIDVKVGEYYEENFPLYALRTIVGTVFIDENGNNKFDAGEAGIPDVEVRVEGNIALSDDTGRFFLKKLKGGPLAVEIETESIPEGYELTGEKAIEVSMEIEGEIKEHVDFAVKLTEDSPI